MDQIKWLQRSLNALGRQPALPEDGEPNAHTRAALVAFQGRYGLPLSGLAGPETQTALKSVLENPETMPPPDVIGVCVHGLGNDVLGIGVGMDILAQELNKKTTMQIFCL
jgi:peptidoglycan hydrolase-like protein with peptidoglycan-binding domain